MSVKASGVVNVVHFGDYFEATISQYVQYPRGRILTESTFSFPSECSELKQASGCDVMT